MPVLLLLTRLHRGHPLPQGERVSRCGGRAKPPLPLRERVGGGGRFSLPARLAASFFLLFAAALVLAGATLAQPKFPPLTGRIVDNAGLLTPEDRAAIESDLTALEQKSSDQVVVYTTNSLQGYPIEDYGYQLGRAWGIGQKGTNNGVVLIVAPKERKVRIEVGRGLEPQLTDLLSSAIIQNRILPRFKRGDFSGGIKTGVDDIRDVLLGDADAVKVRAKARPPERRDAEDAQELITLIIIIAIFLFILWAQSQQRGPPLSGRPPYTRRGGYGGGPIFIPGDWSGGYGGRGGGGGGGWSGGGGDFGGGGASGDW